MLSSSVDGLGHSACDRVNFIGLRARVIILNSVNYLALHCKYGYIYVLCMKY